MPRRVIVDAELDKHFGNVVSHDAPPGMPAGLEGAKTVHEMNMGACPDRNVEVLETIEQGDRVFCSHPGDRHSQGGLSWLDIPANGRTVDIEAWGVYRMDGGRASSTGAWSTWRR